MKLSIGLCLVIYITGVYCEDITTHIKIAGSLNPYISDCLAESKLDMKTLMSVEKNNALPNTPEMQCYLACMMKKEGMMNPYGAFSQQFLEDDRTKACRNQGGKGTCEVAYKTIDCLVKSAPHEESHKSE